MTIFKFKLVYDDEAYEHNDDNENQRQHDDNYCMSPNN